MDGDLATAVAVCLCVVARCGGFVAASTWPSYPGVGVQLRVAVAFAVSAVAMPSVLASARGAAGIEPLAVAAEILLGMAMGTAVACVVATASWAFGMAAAACGLDGGDAGPQPADGAGIARLAWWVSAGGFLASGGSRVVLAGLLDSFSAIPAGFASAPFGDGGAGIASVLSVVATRLPATAFAIAVSFAVPVLASLLAYHAVVAIAMRVSGIEPGTGLVQSAAAVLLLVILSLTADIWIAAFPSRIEAPLGRSFAASEDR